MFTFYDILKIIDNTDTDFYERFILLRCIEELLKIEPDFNTVIDLFIKLPLTKFIKINMVRYEHVDNDELKRNLDMFSKLTTYSRNPLEPLFILCIKNIKYRKEISDVITEVCRGDMIKAMNELYKIKGEMNK